MTDNLNVDNEGVDGGAGNQPALSQQPAKSIDGTPQGSQDLSSIAKSVELLTKELRGMQSRTDKDKNETQRVLEEIKSHMAKGMNFEQAEQAVNENKISREKDELLYKMAEKLGVLGSTSQTVPTGNGTSAVDDTAKVFSDYEIDPNDPAVSPFLSLKGAELKAAVADYAFKKSKQSPRDPSEATTLGGSAASTGKLSDQQADKKYSELGQLIKNPTLNASKISQLTKELKDSGYEV